MIANTEDMGVRLNLAYHSARILAEGVRSGEKNDEEFDTLVYNLAMDLAVLTGNERELCEALPAVFELREDGEL